MVKPSLTDRISSLPLSGFIALSLFLLPATIQARPAPDGFADLVEDVSPAVVSIVVKKPGALAGVPQKQTNPVLPEGSPFRDFFERFYGHPPPNNELPEAIGRGSGFAIDPAGYIVTNNHVVAGASEILVLTDDKQSLLAELVGSDPKTDLALLKVAASAPMPYVSFGDSDEARVGDWALAIGDPFGLGGTVTAGIISARSRNINAGPYDDFIQTDAPINRGNSGGPLFNLDGEVIGINTAIFSPSGGSVGIGFAVSSNLAGPILEEIKADGRVERGWLGVQIQPVTPDLAAGLGLSAPKGALIADVADDGPADIAGLKSGDVIVGLNGRQLESARQLPRLVADLDAGSWIDLAVYRMGAEQTFSVEIGRLNDGSRTPKSDSEANPTADNLGLRLEPLTENIKERLSIPEPIDGVLVTHVDPRSAAAKAGIMRGDIITEVAQQKTKTPGQVTRRIADARFSGMSAVLFQIHRSGRLLFTAAPLTVS